MTNEPHVGHLHCEHLSNPLGIDIAEPRLSWRIESERRGARQTAYQILAATSAEQLADNQADLWDSGIVASDQSIYVVYAGKQLGSSQRAWWKVRI